MKGANSTLLKNTARTMMFLMLCFLSYQNTAFAQLTCACKGNINVSVDQNCEAIITTDMILANATTCGGSAATITLMKTPTGQRLAVGTGTVIFDDASLYIGKTIYAKITEPSGINSCWTTVLIEDKLAPTIQCPDNLTLTCYQMAAFEPIVTENCSHYKLNLVNEEINVNNCNTGLPENVLKIVTRQYQAVDESGNKSPICTMTFTVTGLPSLAPPTLSIPTSKLLLNNTHLSCDADYAKIPQGKPFAGNPSPIAIGNKPGTGIPALLLWTPTVVGSATITQGAAANSLTIGTGATGAASQVCLTSHKDTLMSFNYNISTGGTVTFLVNGSPEGTYTGTGSVANFAVEANDVICFRSNVNNTNATITGVKLPKPFYASLIDASDLYCNIFVTYSDVTIPNIHCVTKILRTWKVLEWSCRAQQRSAEYLQMIEIADNKGPVLTKLADISASTSGHACEGLINLPSIVAKDNCSAEITVDVAYPGGILNNKNGGLALLPIGCHQVIYTVYDNCYNKTTDTINVTIEDNTAPAVVCIQNTVVGLTLGEKTWVPAKSFDNGSYDECQLSKLLVRRMEQTPYSTNCLPCKAPEFSTFTYLGEYGATSQRHYYISKHKASPSVAFKTAVAMGGHLVVLDNAPEDKWVYDEVQKWNLDENYLIGLKDGKHKGLFTWTNESTATYRNWGEDQPYLGYDNDDFTRPYVAVDSESAEWYNLGSEKCEETEILYVVEINDPCGFSEYVGFCCKDVASPTQHQVIFRAVDKAGNYNDCMVNVTVQDKLAPVITCPANVTVTCEDYFDVAKLAHTFGWPTAVDNCEDPKITTDSTVTLNSCRIGTITRNFTAKDRGGREAKCTQHITVIHGKNAFEMTADRWPLDTTFVGCGDPESDLFSPDRLGRPNLTSESICALVGADYEDHVFTFNNPTGPACFKILRKWKVIDWCQTYENDGGGLEYRTWTHTQVIIVSDNVKPNITSSCAPKSAKTYDSECKDGYIELTATGSDVCTKVLKWHYQIDAFNNGSFDAGLSNSGVGNTASASGTYPIGKHKIVWAFEDNCGNITKCEQEFSIVNEKTPVPYCLNGLSTSLMPVDTNNDGVSDGGMIDIWAKDFDRGSSHPCGYPVILSFEPVTRNSTTGKLVVKDSLIFRCAERGEQEVRLYAAVELPDGKIVQDYCLTFIDIQDNNNACKSGNNRIAGSLMTDTDQPVKDVSVALQGSNMKVMTTNNGIFSFDNMGTGGAYVVTPTKNDDHANGVSTLDIVMIQRHILGLKKIDSPYRLIAADINKDAKITASDLTELRKVVLGISSSFPNNESWRFVDKNYVFQDPSTAISETFPEINYIPAFNQDMNIDFRAIKIGDVNGNVVANAQDNNIEGRASRRLSFNTIDQAFKAGEVVTVPMNVTNNEDIAGFQFTINFDADMFSLENVEGGINGMTDANFGFTRLSEGMIATSYSKADNQTLSAGQKVIVLTLKAKTAGSLASGLWIDSAITPAEAYDNDNNVMKVDFEVTGRTQDVAMLYQNTPNPFKATTIIGFDLPQASDAIITIYDVTGKAIKVVKGTYTKGYNSLEINKSELGAAGVMYYTLEAGKYKATRKMIIVE
jgi:hypothetical protein